MRLIDPVLGRRALQAWVAGTATPADLLTAVRYTLGIVEARFPGGALELRVPPAGAVQIFSGTNHRRGTPPAVVEMSPQVWLALATGGLDWDTALASGQVLASGQRSDLSKCLPVFSGGHFSGGQ